MEPVLPFMLAIAIGFGHAFEADHLVAVSSMVTRRNNLFLAVKDGIYWGLGHTSTIILIGCLIVLGRVVIGEVHFSALEGLVGLMLILLGLYRMARYYRDERHTHQGKEASHSHQMAYGVGLVHGLAGSGAVVLLAMTEINGSWNSMVYLLLFGLGSVAGMLLAAGLFSLPFSKRWTTHPRIRFLLIMLSALLCIGYGGIVIGEHWW